MSLSANAIRATVESPRYKSFPARTNVVFYQGAIVCKRAGSKYAEIPDPAAPRTDLIPLGVARCELDMTGVASGTYNVLVECGGKRDFSTGSGANEITANNVGETWYMYDDTTAYLTDNGGTLSAGGSIVFVDTDEYDGTTNVSVYFDYENANVLSAIKSLGQSLVLDAATEITIAAGVATVTQSNHTIDTEADAASDNLDTIAGMVAGQLYVFSPANAARTVVIRDASVGGGNIRTPFAQSISLAEDDDYVLAVSDGTDVTVVGFRTLAADGGGAGAIIGLLSALTTTDKSTVVAAVNEVRVPVAQILTSRTTTVGAKLVLAEGTDNGANAVTVAAPDLLAGDVVVTLPEDDLDLGNVPELQSFDLTLVTGTATNNTTAVVAARSEVIAYPIGAITGTTNFGCVHEVKASRVNGGAGVGVVVIQAKGNDGNIDADAAGVVRVNIFTPPV
jgi:hypothetical protein